MMETATFENGNGRLFRLWRVAAPNEFVGVVAEADTLEDIKRVPRRSDWRYQVTRSDGKPIDERTGYPILRLPGQDLTSPESAQEQL
jgi:hypothetical protein